MNLMRHDRIEQIKKLSATMRGLLTAVNWLVWILLPLVVAGIVLVPAHGTVKISDEWRIPVGQLPLLQRILLAAVVGAALLVTQRVVHHSRDVLAHFSQGDIFNHATLASARRAIRYGIVLVATDVLREACLAGHQALSAGVWNISAVISTMLNGFLFFGLMYLVLWTLEIGRDLNEESELTI
ncbi:hypothetical protein ACLB1G_22255 [Oxalobacteraceae bacterium A2-2]